MKSLFLAGLLGSLALNVAALSSERSVSAVPVSTPTACSVTPDAPRPTQRAHVNPLLAAFDADGDGKLGAAEIDHASQLLRMLDANRDGCLTADEFPLPCGNL